MEAEEEEDALELLVSSYSSFFPVELERPELEPVPELTLRPEPAEDPLPELPLPLPAELPPPLPLLMLLPPPLLAKPPPGRLKARCAERGAVREAS